MSESKIYRTNMVSTKDKKLVVAHNNDLMPSRGNFNQWNDSSQNLYQWKILSSIRGKKISEIVSKRENK